MKTMIFIWFLYAEKISTLEEKIEYQETELQRKGNIISELSAQLEAEKIKNEYQLQVEEISISEFAYLLHFEWGTNARSLLLKYLACLCLLD